MPKRNLDELEGPLEEGVAAKRQELELCPEGSEDAVDQQKVVGEKQQQDVLKPQQCCQDSLEVGLKSQQNGLKPHEDNEKQQPEAEKSLSVMPGIQESAVQNAQQNGAKSLDASDMQETLKVDTEMVIKNDKNMEQNFSDSGNNDCEISTTRGNDNDLESKSNDDAAGPKSYGICETENDVGSKSNDVVEAPDDIRSRSDVLETTRNTNKGCEIVSNIGSESDKLSDGNFAAEVTGNEKSQIQENVPGAKQNEVSSKENDIYFDGKENLESLDTNTDSVEIEQKVEEKSDGGKVTVDILPVAKAVQNDLSVDMDTSSVHADIELGEPYEDMATDDEDLRLVIAVSEDEASFDEKSGSNIGIVEAEMVGMDMSVNSEKMDIQAETRALMNICVDDVEKNEVCTQNVEITNSSVDNEIWSKNSEVTSMENKMQAGNENEAPTEKMATQSTASEDSNQSELEPMRNDEAAASEESLPSVPEPARTEETTSEEGEDGVVSEDSNSSVHTNSSTDVPSSSCLVKERFSPISLGKKKRRVKFKSVTVFYFPRKQGFVCVPSQGGSTLGMGDRHMQVEEFSLGDYTRHMRQLHRNILVTQQQQQHQQPGARIMHASLLKATHSLDDSFVCDDLNEEELEFEEGDSDISDYYFLQPIPTRQRRLLLRQSGIKKIDTTEKEICKDIRLSREFCGCDCRVYCDPKTCACSLAGISCQVDRLSFPCGCSKDGCSNMAGRVEFNPIRVRTHFIHTLMRLEMEKKREEEREQLKRQLGYQSEEEDEEGPAPRAQSPENKLYNSNEMGSCRDCQKSEMTDLIMQHSAYVAKTNAQAAAEMAAEMAAPHDCKGELKSPINMNVTSQEMMYGEAEEEEYGGAENSAPFTLTKEDGSYSESSDCSSEENSPCENYQTFPINPYAGQNMADAGEGPSRITNPTYCADYNPPVPAQKYAELSNVNAAPYKLEPISEILSPIRFPTYTPATVSQTWGGCYGGYSPQASMSPSPHNSPPYTSPVHTSPPYPSTTDNYLYPPNPVAPPTTMSCMLQSPLLPPCGTNLTQQTVPNCDAYKPYKNDSNILEPKLPKTPHGEHSLQNEEQKVYHELTSSSPRLQNSDTVTFTPLTPVSSTNVVTSTSSQNDLNGYQELSSSAQPTTPITEPVPIKYHDLSTLSSSVKYHDLSLSTMAKSASHTTTVLCSTNTAVTTESQDIYQLPQQQAVPVSPDSPSAASSNSSQLVDSSSPQSPETSGESSQKLRDVSSLSPTPNFGEIIKESIVETVSA